MTDDDPEPVDDEPEPDLCCVCHRPAVGDYAGRDDCPSCGGMACEWQMQQYLDYSDEVGNR